MTRDYKQNGTDTPSSQYAVSWVLGGIAVGLLAGALAYAMISPQSLSTITQTIKAPVAAPPSDTQTPENSTLATQENSPTLQDTPPSDNRPGFSYHAVLPQLEIDVAIPAPQEAAPSNTQPLPQVTEDQETTEQIQQAQRYMFQLGAYRNRSQAAQMQQRAKQNGMNTRVETAKIKGQTWYRVRLGPTDSIQIVNRWKQRLSSMGINPMMIRL